MDRSEFFKAVCLHYGKPSMHEGKPVRIPREYDEVIGKDVAEWIRSYAVTHEDFQPLFDELKGRYSANYGKLPDRVQLQEAAKIVAESVVRGDPRPKPEPLSDEEHKALVATMEQMMRDLKRGPMAPERRDPYKVDDRD